MSSLFWRFYEYFTAQPVQPRAPTPVEQAKYEFLPTQRGKLLSNKYVVHFKLGGGMYSETWLVSTATKSRSEKRLFYAAKILSVDATKDHHEGIMLELKAMEKLRETVKSPLLPTLREHFELRHETYTHICMVMDLLGSDVGSFRRCAPEKALPDYTVRVIIRQVLEALVLLHNADIVHTDLKPDNILFRSHMSVDDIDRWSVQEAHDDGNPHPLPLPLAWDCPPEEAAKIEVTLVDLGQCQWAKGKPTVDQFSAFSLRAPEVVLRSDFGTALDIWAVGCLVFEMISGRWLFHPTAGADWTSEDDHLAKMLEFTGSERFPADMIARADLRDTYFDGNGDLLRIDELYPVSIEEALGNYDIVRKDVIGPAAAFIRRCIVLDPNLRPTAAELLEDPWLNTSLPSSSSVP